MSRHRAQHSGPILRADLEQGRDEGGAAQVGDAGPLELVEERARVEPRVESAAHGDPGGHPAQRLAHEGADPARRTGLAPPQPGVDGGSRGGLEAQQRVQGIAVLVGAVDALAPGRAAEDVGGVEVQRHLGHSRGTEGVALDDLERLVQLADVAQGEAAQPGARRLGGRNRKAPQQVCAASARVTARSSRQRAPSAIDSAIDATNSASERPRAARLEVQAPPTASSRPTGAGRLSQQLSSAIRGNRPRRRADA